MPYESARTDKSGYWFVFSCRHLTKKIDCQTRGATFVLFNFLFYSIFSPVNHLQSDRCQTAVEHSTKVIVAYVKNEVVLPGEGGGTLSVEVIDMFVGNFFWKTLKNTQILILNP